MKNVEQSCGISGVTGKMDRNIYIEILNTEFNSLEMAMESKFQVVVL